MEDHAVVKAFLGIFDDARDMAGREVGAQLDHDVAAAVEGEGKRFVGHEKSSLAGDVGMEPI